MRPTARNGLYRVAGPEREFVVKLYTALEPDMGGLRLIVMDDRPVATWDDGQGIAYVWKEFRGTSVFHGVVSGYRWSDSWSDTEKMIAIWCDLVVRGAGGHWKPRGYLFLLEARCVSCNDRLTEAIEIETGQHPWLCAREI